MNKRVILLVTILSVVMMLVINVKASTSCNYGCRGDNGGMGPPCVDRTKDSCGSPPGCSWKCVSCTNGGTYNSSGNGSCSCPTPSTPVVTDNCTGKYSKGEGGCTMTSTGTGTLSCSSSDTSMATVSMAGNTCTVTPVGSPKTDTCTKDVTVTITLTNSCGGTSSATGDVTVMTPWGAGTPNVKVWVEANTKISKEVAEAKGYSTAYEGCGSKTSGGYWLCTKYTRGCGKSTPNPEPHCYEKDDLLYWGIYSKVKDGKEVIDSEYTLVSSITEPKQCVSQFKCTTSEPSGSNETVCNGQGEINGTYTRKCESIYTIECKEKITTNFIGPAYDWTLESSNNAYLYPGTGFKYKFTANSNFSCEGKFDKDRYNKVKKYIEDYANSVGGDIVSLNGKFYSSALEGLEYIRDSYTKWDPKYEDKSNVTIHDELESQTLRTVTLKGVTDNEFVLLEPTCGQLPKDKTGSAQLNDFVYEERHYLEKEVPMAYLNNKGEIVYGEYSCSDCDLGKKFFVTDNREHIIIAEKNKYNYIVNATGLGYHGFASDKTTCNIQLLDNGIIYRHIDLKDPFLKNSNHKIGTNWLNSKYDFTRIIKPSVWSEDSMYNTVRLEPDTNKQIKSDVKNNSNYHIGACTRGNASSADVICKLLKLAQK